MKHIELLALLSECRFTTEYPDGNVRHFGGVKAQRGMTTLSCHVIEVDTTFCITAKTNKLIVWRMELSNNIPRPVLKKLLTRLIGWCTDDVAVDDKPVTRHCGSW